MTAETTDTTMKGPDDLGPFLALAERLADTVRPIVRSYFRSGLAIEDKADQSPVTRADREAERAMRDIIGEAFPAHGIYGEEHGVERPDAEYVWVLDPIDGTRSFVTGVPLFGTLIALCRGGAPVLGVCDMPALGERWVGAAGQATTFNGEPCHARACADIAGAWLFTTTPDMYSGDGLAAFERLSAACKDRRFGTDCYAMGLLASGMVDVVCEADVAPYDYLAHVPIIEGAGGVVSDWDGAPLTLASGDRMLAAGDAGVHAQALAALKGQ